MEVGGHTAYRLAPLVHNATGNYLLVFSANRLTVFRRGVAIYSLPTPQILPSQLECLKFSALRESLLITHVDMPPSSCKGAVPRACGRYFRWCRGMRA
jgi:hypothetical protein